MQPIALVNGYSKLYLLIYTYFLTYLLTYSVHASNSLPYEFRFIQIVTIDEFEISSQRVIDVMQTMKLAVFQALIKLGNLTAESRCFVGTLTPLKSKDCYRPQAALNNNVIA